MYDKLLQLLVWSVVKPDRAMILGGTWRVPVKMKLLDSGFVEDIKSDATVSEAIFQREYKILYSINCINCWKILRAYLLQHKYEIKLSVNA